MNNTKQEKKSIMNIGTSLMIVILIGLSFIVIAALAISSAKNNYDLTEKYDMHTKAYYDASNEAYKKIAKDNWADNTYQIEIDDKQVLNVEVADHQIKTWQVTNSATWEMDDSLPVHQEESLDAPLPVHQ